MGPDLFILASSVTQLRSISARKDHAQAYRSSTTDMRPSLLRSLPQPQSQLSPAESKTILSWLQHFKLSGGLTPPRHADCYELSYSRSSGPGGQNVNKLATKATVRFDLAKASTWLPGHVQRGLAVSSFYAHSTHSLVLSSMRHRTQPANARDCLEKCVR
jgi:peptidyl-tRNA hydrolase ICT1